MLYSGATDCPSWVVGFYNSADVSRKCGGGGGDDDDDDDSRTKVKAKTTKRSIASVARKVVNRMTHHSPINAFFSKHLSWINLGWVV